MSNALDKLTIKGFKSIKSLEDFELTNLNILIGGNGAGKSNFIDFFRLLREMMDGNLNDYIRKSGGISDLLFNGRKVTEQLEIETRFGTRGYRFNIFPGAKEDFSITNEARYYEYGTSGWWGFGDSDEGISRLAQEAKSNTSDAGKSKYVYDAVTSWQIYHFHDTSKNATMRHYEIVQDNRNLRFNGANIAPYLLKLKNKYSDCYNEITEAVRLVTPFFDDFILKTEEYGQKQKVNLSWRQKGSDYPMQPYHLSDGSIRFICLATAMLQPHPPATIIIDEPELGLHPFAINVLAELIQSAAKRTQLIIATQSPAFIDNFYIENIIVVNRKQGASTFERLEEKNFNAWLEKYSIGELWSKNVISGGAVHE
ncbi:AAA family ATPase [Planctomycetota bacterium]